MPASKNPIAVAALVALPALAAGDPPAKVPGFDPAAIDRNTAPCADFYQFACGNWMARNPVPPDRARWGRFDELAERNQTALRGILEKVSASDPRRDPIDQKIGDQYAACMDEAAIEAKGIAALKPEMDRIDAIASKAELPRALAHFHSGGVNAAFRFGSVPDFKDANSVIAGTDQGGLGLPDREFYVSAEPPMRALRTRYQEYIGRLMSLAGFDRPDQRAQAVMALETAMAQAQATGEVSANDHNADSLWTRADFARRAPGMDWSNFFAAAGLASQETFVAWQPTALTGLAALVGSQSVETWKDYLRFHLLDRYSDVLPRGFVAAAFALHGAVTGQSEPAPRAQRALEATQTAMSDALGQMYAERFFPAEQKARVQAIVANVAAAFAKRVEAATWMSPATKTQALAKLKTLYIGIGYPEKWPDYSDLAVDPGDAVGNLRRVEDRNYRHALARLGRPVDMTEWWIAPQRVGAILVFQLNAYHFSAALLQVPKYDPAASDAANYGAIGAIIGHDVSHYVDMLGADYDTTGAMRHWWTVEDLARFQALVEPLVNQYSSYQPLPGLSIDGKRTQTENIADLAGLAAAFDAYRETLGSRASDPAYLRQQDREFFIGYARSWRSKQSESAMRTQVASDNHAPDEYRIATVRNIDAWYDAFDVQPGQRLYLEPKARVRIW